MIDSAGFDAEARWPLNGPLFSPLNPLYSLTGEGVTGPLSTNWSGRVLQAISSVMIFRCSFVNEKFSIFIKVHWSFFLRIQ